MTDTLIEPGNSEAALDLALQRALENLSRDPTVATYLERFPVEHRDRALRDAILERLVRWNLEDWLELSGGVSFVKDRRI